MIHRWRNLLPSKYFIPQIRNATVTPQLNLRILTPFSLRKSLTMSFGINYEDIPKIRQWDMNPLKFPLSCNFPARQRIMTLNFDPYKNALPTSLDQSTFSSIKSGRWRGVGLWTQMTSWSSVRHSPSLYVINWPQPLERSTQCAWKTCALPRESASNRIAWTLWTHPNFRRRLNLPRLSSRLLNLNKLSHPIIITAETIFLTIIQIRERIIRTPRVITPTMMMTVPLFARTTTPKGGTTEENGRPANGEEGAAVADHQGESRRTNRSLLRRMADCYRQPRFPKNYQGRIQDSIRTHAASIDQSPSSSSPIGGGSQNSRSRSVRFADQRSDRMREWARLYKPFVRDSEKDRGPSTCLEPSSFKPILTGDSLQNGNYTTRMQSNKEKRLFDIYRSERCLFTCKNSSGIEEIPSISMEGTALPIQGPPVRTVTSSDGVHKSTQTITSLGQKSRHQDICLSRRLNNSSGNQREITDGDDNGFEEAETVRFLDKGVQVESEAIAKTGTSWVRNRHHIHDLEDPGKEVKGCTSRSLQAYPQGNVLSPSTIIIHREGYLNDSSRLSSASQGSTSNGRQDTSIEIRRLMGELNISFTRGNRGATLVAITPQAMERIVMDYSQLGIGHLYRCLRYGMGNSDGQQIAPRNLVSSDDQQAHQLQGTPHSFHCVTTTRSSWAHSEHNSRQPDDFSLHQPFWRDQVARIDEIGDIDMELVHEDRDSDQNNLCSLIVQSGRRPIQKVSRTTRVVHRQKFLPQAKPGLGSTPRRSLRLTNQPPTATVHDLETNIRRHRLRRSAARLEKTRERLSMSTLEFNTSGPSESAAGKDSGNHNNSRLAICSMVPDGEDNVHRVANRDSTTSGPSSPWKRAGHISQESSLVTLRMENKRRKLMDKGWDSNTASIIVDNPALRRRQQKYSTVQQRYVTWVRQRGIDPMIPQPAQLLNWLASGISDHGWTSATAMAYKSAVINLYDDKTPFLDEDFIHFFQAIRRREIIFGKEINFDIKPVIDFLCKLGPNKDLPLLRLTQKLCWLLGTCGFLRANDIMCINIMDDKFLIKETSITLPILIPKETRGGKRVCKYIPIQGHRDPLLCPVATLTEYLGRIEGHPIVVPHPKDHTIMYRPLLRDVRDLDRPIGSERISKHIKEISSHLVLPGSAKIPKARAIGSTSAIANGASVNDVITQGHWSSASMLSNFYLLHNSTEKNLTAMILP